MLKLLQNRFYSMDKVIKKIMYYGFLFSLLVAIASVVLLVTYEFSQQPDLYYLGLSVLQLSFFFFVEFIVCALAVDTIKNGVTKV